jgi:phage baseplate assembly protein W
MALKTDYLDDETRDLKINSLKLIEMAEGIDAHKQRIKIRLSINRGEWFLNPEIGIPWHDLLNNNATPEQIRAEIQKELSKDEYISTIDYVRIDELDRANRTLYLSYSVKLKTGEIVATEEEVSI